MSILFWVLLYVLCVAAFCALTGINRLDDPEPQPRSAEDLGVAPVSEQAHRFGT